MKQGKEIRFECIECRTEFDLVYEPRGDESRPETARAICCPFCHGGLYSDDDREVG